MTQNPNEGGAFTFDDDEDMELILAQAAQAGSAAADEQQENLEEFDKLFGIESEPDDFVAQISEPKTQPSAQAAPDEELQHMEFDFELHVEDVQSPEPQAEPVAVEPENTPDAFEELEREIEKLQAETLASQEETKISAGDSVRAHEPVRKSQAEPAAAEPVEEPISETPETKQEPVEPSHHSAPRIVRQTEQEKIAHARAILEAADEYRKLSVNARNVVGQLISQEAEFSDDPAVIAVRAIDADELTFKTFEAFKNAKGEEPVDRAFYILGLPFEVRVSLGQLCTAFTGDEMKPSESLSYSRELVKAIDKLDNDAVSFVVAAEAVLRAAKQS